MVPETVSGIGPSVVRMLSTTMLAAVFTTEIWRPYSLLTYATSPAALNATSVGVENVPVTRAPEVRVARSRRTTPIRFVT